MASIERYGAISRQEIEINGFTKTLKEWAEHFNLPYATVRMRYARGHRDPAKLFFRGVFKDPLFE